MKYTYRITVVRYGEKTRQTILTCTPEGLVEILRKHKARGVSATAEVAHWDLVDDYGRRATGPD